MRCLSSRTAGIALTAMGAALLTGCGIDPDVKAKIEVADECRVAILPADDPEFGGMFSSPRGQQISQLATVKAKQEVAPEVFVRTTDYAKKFNRRQKEFFESSPLEALERDDIDPNNLDVQEIADEIKAEYILYPRIISWERRADGSFNLLQGKAVVEVTYYDNRKETLREVKSMTFTARYPESWNNQYGVAAINSSEDEIEQGLIRTVARKLAELFYDHDDPNMMRTRLD